MTRPGGEIMEAGEGRHARRHLSLRQRAGAKLLRLLLRGDPRAREAMADMTDAELVKAVNQAALW